MTNSNDNIQQNKLSPEFTSRLSHLKPGQKIRAIIMLRTENASIPPARARTHGKHQAIIESIRKSTASALPDIDGILERFNGKRLATSLDALGYIPIETTAAGIAALAASKHVKAILEDQPISLLRGDGN